MNAEELAETWRQHASRLVLIARAIGGPAEDAVQEAFLQLARQRETPDDPFAWLVRVTRNQLLQWRRHGLRRRRRERAVRRDVWFSGQCESIEQSLDAQAVTESLRQLAADQREVIVMHLWGEMKFEEIAAIVNVSSSTVHRRYHLGIERMKQQFRPENPLVSRPGAIHD